ncbi:hypothetical protein BGW80DRAFT_1497360 [Lactifluus volemus]|nr:hypothetical protein BGW80DRAFT_1497360 [Lactifluus volemus]
MTALPPFQLNVMSPTSEMTPGPHGPPASVVLRLDDLRTDSPATSRKPGSFNYDCESGSFPEHWPNMAEFEVWRRAEELAYSIEFVAARVVRGDGLWTLRRRFVCSRQRTGGKGTYQKKCPDRQEIRSKKTGCPCKIVIKCYPHTPIVRGRYEGDHDHGVGSSNIPFIRISSASRERIRGLLDVRRPNAPRADVASRVK